MTLPLFLLISALGAGWTVLCLSLVRKNRTNHRTHRLAKWLAYHGTIK